MTTRTKGIELLRRIAEAEKKMKECVGCGATENLEYCGGTMCRKCWEAENEEHYLD